MTAPVIATVVGLGLYAIAMTWLVVYMAATASGKATGSHHHREELRPAVRRAGPERPVPDGPVSGTGPALPVELAHDAPGYQERIASGLALLTPALPALPPMIAMAPAAADETAIDMTAIGDE